MVTQIAGWTALDPLADRIGGWVGRWAGQGGRKRALSGTWLGHPLHPALTDLPVGAWTLATALDVVAVGKAQQTADTLVGLGLVAAIPTAAAGWSDWSDTVGEDRRVGLAHAMANQVAAASYAVSLLQRVRGRRWSARLWGLIGFTSMTAGAYLGGHLTFGRGLGVDHTVFESMPDEWLPVLSASDLAEGQTVLGEARGVQVMLHRRGSSVYALLDRCTHAGGPLHEGDIDPSGDACVTCPWHGSRFRLADGAVVDGPATFSQPVLETRVRDGQIEVRRPPTP